MNPKKTNVISIEAVTATLEGLIYGSRSKHPSQLIDLCLVDDFLKDQNFPITPHARNYAIQSILTMVIEDQFRCISKVFQIMPPSREGNYEEALQHIIACSRPARPELTGWCWLYYHYVRTELEITREQFSSLCYINIRTLRRYQTFILTKLTWLLIEAEWVFRFQ